MRGRWTLGEVGLDGFRGRVGGREVVIWEVGFVGMSRNGWVGISWRGQSLGGGGFGEGFGDEERKGRDGKVGDARRSL